MVASGFEGKGRLRSEPIAASEISHEAAVDRKQSIFFEKAALPKSGKRSKHLINFDNELEETEAEQEELEIPAFIRKKMN